MLEPRGTRGLIEVGLIVFFVALAGVTIGVLLAPAIIR